MLNHTAEPLKSLAVGSARARPSDAGAGWPLGAKRRPVEGTGGCGGVQKGRLGMRKNLDWKRNRRNKDTGKDPICVKCALIRV